MCHRKDNPRKSGGGHPNPIKSCILVSPVLSRGYQLIGLGEVADSPCLPCYLVIIILRAHHLVNLSYLNNFAVHAEYVFSTCLFIYPAYLCTSSTILPIELLSTYYQRYTGTGNGTSQNSILKVTHFQLNFNRRRTSSSIPAKNPHPATVL